MLDQTPNHVTLSHEDPHYWRSLLADFSLSSKLWIEDFCSFKLEKPQSSPIFNKISYTIKFDHQTQFDLFKQIIPAVWSILLNRYSGSDDVIFGTRYLDDRGSADDFNLSTLLFPTRSTIIENDTIESYINKISSQLIVSLSAINSYFSDQALVNEFDPMINYVYIRQKKLNSFSDYICKINSDDYPLLLITNEENPKQIELYYSDNKFTKDSIDNMLVHFQLFIDHLSTETNGSIAHLNLLTQDEKEKLNAWGKPSIDFLKGQPIPCFHEFFREATLKNPNHLAVNDKNNSLSYQQLDEISNQLSHLLLEKNIHIGDSIAVLMDRSPALIVTMLAIFKTGAIYIPINPKYPDERIDFVLNDCKPKLIIANNADRIPASFSNITHLLDDKYHKLNTYQKTKIPRKFTSDELAYIIYTSGTTGQPKGVMIKHNSLTNLALWYQHCFNINTHDKVSQFASSGFDSFFCETIPTLAAGASLHIIDDHEKLTPGILIPWLEKESITICDLPTSYAQILFHTPWPTQMSLRLIKLGGESISQYPNYSFPFDIWNIYGPTETTVECTFYKMYEANTPPEHYANKRLPPPIGKPIANSEMYVVDQHLERVPIGCVGELLVGGIVISPGYHDRKQLTRDKFIRNIFSSDPEAKLYRTGDLVRWLPDGNIEFIGRVDNQVKIRGYRIELSEVESIIRQYPDISEVVVLAKEIVNGQKSLLAYLVPNLDKIRIPYQEKCLLNLDDIKYIEVMSDDISKEGVAVTGLTDVIAKEADLRINIKLPGTSDGQWLSGKLMWQVDQRGGIKFDKTTKQENALNKCIEYYLATHNLMETIQSASAKRNIRKAIKSKVPEYMVPSVFSILPSFPLTFNGKIDWKSLPPPKDFERLLERQFVAPRTDTEKTIADMWCHILNLKSASMTDNFFDLGANSLMVSQLSVQIMKKFNISIPVKVFIDLPFIPVIAEYIDSKGEKYTNKSTIQNEIHHDAILNDDILPTKKLGDLRSPGGILLTGVSGFLGIYLLRELLKKTDAKIYCLIRKGEFETAAKRLVTTIEQYDLSNEIMLSNRRIIILEGDIGMDQFGISAQQYNSMADKIDTIYHCGAQVNTMASYTTLRTSNVLGTIEIIKFATKSIDKAIHYISTLSAAVKLDEDGCFAEEFPDSDARTLVGGYAISKWISERLLTQIKSRGLPVSIYRSGHIFGQADNGVTSVNNSLLYFIKGCIQLGMAPNWNEHITFIPVDFASQAIVDISLEHPEVSAVYHLDHPHGMMWSDMVAWLQSYGYIITLCSPEEWRHQLTMITEDNALYPFLPQYLADEIPPPTPPTNIEHAATVLKSKGIDFPEITDSLLQIYFNYLCRVDFLPTPSVQNQRLSTLPS